MGHGNRVWGGTLADSRLVASGFGGRRCPGRALGSARLTPLETPSAAVLWEMDGTLSIPSSTGWPASSIGTATRNMDRGSRRQHRCRPSRVGGTSADRRFQLSGRIVNDLPTASSSMRAAIPWRPETEKLLATCEQRASLSLSPVMEAARRAVVASCERLLQKRCRDEVGAAKTSDKYLARRERFVSRVSAWHSRNQPTERARRRTRGRVIVVPHRSTFTGSGHAGES